MVTSPSVSVPLIDEDPSDVEEDQELHEDNDTSSESQHQTGWGVHVRYPPHGCQYVPPPHGVASMLPPTLFSTSPHGYEYPPHRWCCSEQERDNAYALPSEDWDGPLQDCPAYLYLGEEITTGDVGRAVLPC